MVKVSLLFRHVASDAEVGWCLIQPGCQQNVNCIFIVCILLHFIQNILQGCFSNLYCTETGETADNEQPHRLLHLCPNGDTLALTLQAGLRKSMSGPNRHCCLWQEQPQRHPHWLTVDVQLLYCRPPWAGQTTGTNGTALMQATLDHVNRCMRTEM